MKPPYNIKKEDDMTLKEFDQKVRDFEEKIKAERNGSWTFGDTSRVLNFISDLVKNHDIED